MLWKSGFTRQLVCKFDIFRWRNLDFSYPNNEHIVFVLGQYFYAYPALCEGNPLVIKVSLHKRSVNSGMPRIKPVSASAGFKFLRRFHYAWNKNFRFDFRYTQGIWRMFAKSSHISYWTTILPYKSFWASYSVGYSSETHLNLSRNLVCP